MDRQPLHGIRVIELATGVSGPYAGKLLADYGADVVKVEPPGGDPSRNEGAGWGDRPDPEASPLFLHLNTSKRSVVADLDDPDGVELVRRLVATADVLIESEAPGRLAAVGLRADELRQANPALVVASVTPFGRTGPLAGEAGGDLVAYAMGGPMQATGDPDREPMKLAGRIVAYHCGSVAALATLAAVTMAQASGQGTDVDVANYETQASSIDRRAALAIGYQYDGEVGTRIGGGRLGPIPAGIYPSADGYSQIVFAPNWMPRLAAMLEDDELARRFADPGWIDDEELPDLLNAAIFSWTLTRTKQEAMEEAQAWGLAVMPVNTTTEVLADPHFGARGFWHEAEHLELGPYRAPGAPFRMADGWCPSRPPPTLDQHRSEVLAELADREGPTDRPVAGAGGGDRRLPLEGVRVLDLTVVWAGPLCTTLLSDLGAEVIRLDNPNLFPTATRGAIPRPPRGRESDMGQFWGRFPDGDGGERPWNRVGAFTCHARNKLGATLDLRTEQGRDTFLDLVAVSDVLVENNSVKVLPSLGLGWEELRASNPRLIMLRMPSLGLDGPYNSYVGFGAHLEALCGLSSLRGYRDLDPTSLDGTYFMDPASGVSAAFATLCALRRRERTGHGELIEFAQAENLLNYIGEYLIDASVTGEPHECHGNRHPNRSPQGAYRCRDGDGDGDAWMVLSVPDDRAWADLAEAMGAPGWAVDPALATEAGRRAAADHLDEQFSTWAAGRTVAEAVDLCRSAGVEAGPVLDEAGLYGDPHLRERGFFRTNGSADVPPIEMPGHQWRWDGPPMRWDRLNVMGRDNDAVYRGLLGRTDAEMAAMEAEGHLADGYRDAEGRPL